MKKLLLLSLTLLLFAACNQSGKNADAAKSEITAAAVKTVELKVEGMTCTGCENTIQTAVSELPGVSTIKADHLAGKATVAFDTTKTTVASIADAIKNAGYQVIE
ncbi:MAG: copper ion binding protein [Bacteroidales bacterium]